MESTNRIRNGAVSGYSFFKLYGAKEGPICCEQLDLCTVATEVFPAAPPLHNAIGRAPDGT